MKANRSFRRSDDASAQGFILFLIFAAVGAFAIIVAFDIRIGPTDELIVNFEPIVDNSNRNIALRYLSGTEFAPGTWKVSVTSGLDSEPVYAMGNSTFRVEESIVFNTTTVASVGARVGTEYNGGTPIVRGDYRVVFFSMADNKIFADKWAHVE